jgi:hypothetical protein
MTQARVEEVYEDRLGARTFLDQAERFKRDANAPEISFESQSVLLHNAAIAACDAILQANGRRVTPGDGAHVLRLDTALKVVAGDSDDLLERLEASRSRRNEASYAAEFVSQASVDDAREATAELIELAREFVGDPQATL